MNSTQTVLDFADRASRNHLRHSDGLASEFAALDKVAPHLASLRSRILEAVTAAGAFGVTPDEWALENRALINTVRRRFTDLWKDGFICHHPQLINRANAAGNDCVVWVVGLDPQCVKRRASSDELLEIRQRLTALERVVAEL